MTRQNVVYAQSVIKSHPALARLRIKIDGATRFFLEGLEGTR